MNKEIQAEDARQRALKELPGLVELPLAEIQSLIDRKIAPRATAKSLSALERARAALAQANYDEVFQAADDQKQQGRELAMLEGTAALARFRESPKPEWNTRALAAFQRAMALADPNSPTDWQAWTDAAVSASSVLYDLARYAEAEPVFRRDLDIFEKSYGPDHPNVARDLNNLASLLQATNRLSQAEPQYRRALAIDEKSYGPGHPIVAIRLNNLALLFQATNRLSEAEPLMARGVCVLCRFLRSTGHEHPNLRLGLENYRQLLTELKLAVPEIARRIKAATEATDKLPPIVPEVERLLGPAKPVADVLISLDRQYREQGKPRVYYLKPDEPIAPHLDELLRPGADEFNAQAVRAFRKGAHADAVVLSEAALEVLVGQPAQAPAKLTARMNCAAALRELGQITQASDELVRLIPELDQAPAPGSTTKGRARYHLSLCQWRLGDRDSAKRSAKTSLAAYDAAPKAGTVDPALHRQSEELLAALKAGGDPPPLAKIDAPAALEAVRARSRACACARQAAPQPEGGSPARPVPRPGPVHARGLRHTRSTIPRARETRSLVLAARSADRAAPRRAVGQANEVGAGWDIAHDSPFSLVGRKSSKKTTAATVF